MKIFNINSLKTASFLQCPPSKTLQIKENQQQANQINGHAFSPAFNGKIQCDFLDSKQVSLINNSILSKFADISAADIRKELALVQKTNPEFTESKFLSNVIAKCEFCNIRDFDKVFEYIKDNHMQLLVVEDIDLSSSLAYLQTKRNPKDQVKITKVPIENLAAKAASLSKKNPAVILTKFSIESFEKLAQDKPEEFLNILKTTNFLYPKNSINGVNAFSLTNTKEIIEKGLTKECDEKEIEKFFRICNENIKKISSEEPIELKFHEIRNPLNYSVEAIARRLKYRHRFFEKHDESFMPTARIMRQIQCDSGYNFFASEMPKVFTDFRNSIFRHSTLLTPIKLNRGLKNLYEKITAQTGGNEVYYLPKFDKPKSFNYMLSSYFRINNIPKEKLLKDLSQLKPEQKIVILDDYIGSGESMIAQFEKLKKANVNPQNIIIASVVTTKRGQEALKEYTSNLVSSKIISQYDIKKTGVYHLSNMTDDRNRLVALSEDAMIGGYNGGLDNFSTFYMTPNNNNNLFFSNIAPGFVMSAHGIKAAFNTFDKTIKEAELPFLTDRELKDIIEIYKKANAIIPECIIKKIIKLTPNDSENLINVLHTYGKMDNPDIPFDIATYLKASLADIDIKKVNNIFVVDNIMDICKYIGIEPPIKFVSSMLNELMNPKTKVPDVVLLHFYLKLIDQLSPLKDVNARIADIVKNLKQDQIIKFNILEDVLQIYNYHNAKPPQNILKRVYEVMDNVEQKNISLELFTLILKTPQIDEKKLDKRVCEKWWATIPENIKQSADNTVLEFFNGRLSTQGGNL